MTKLYKVYFLICIFSPLSLSTVYAQWKGMSSFTELSCIGISPEWQRLTGAIALTNEGKALVTHEISINEKTYESYKFSTDGKETITKNWEKPDSIKLSSDSVDRVVFVLESAYGTRTAYRARNTEDWHLLYRAAYKCQVFERESKKTLKSAQKIKLNNSFKSYLDTLQTITTTPSKQALDDAQSFFLTYRILRRWKAFPTIAYQYIGNHAARKYYSDGVKDLQLFNSSNIYYNVSQPGGGIVEEVATSYLLGVKVDASISLGSQKDSNLRNSVDSIKKLNTSALQRIATNTGNLSLGMAFPVLDYRNADNSIIWENSIDVRYGLDIKDVNASSYNSYIKSAFRSTITFDLENIQVKIGYSPGTIFTMSAATKEYHNLKQGAFYQGEFSTAIVFNKTIGLTLTRFHTDYFTKQDRSPFGGVTALGLVLIPK